MPDRTVWLAVLAAAAAAMLLGSSFVATRALLSELTPAPLAMLRFVLAGAFLAVLAWAAGGLGRIAASSALPILALGLLQFGLFHLAFNNGLAIIPASRAAIVFSLVTVGTMVLAVVTGQERVRLPRLAGVLCAIAGVAVALADQATLQAVDGTAWHGDLLILVAVACGSIYNGFSPRFLARGVSPAMITVVAMAGGVVFLLPFAVAEGAGAQLAALGGHGIALLLFLAVPAGAGSFYLWNWALRRTTPTRVAIFLPLSPITATALGAWLLAEPVGARVALGLALVAAGIWLAHWPAAPGKPKTV